MLEPVNIYTSATHKVNYYEFGDMFTLYQWNKTTKTWDFLDDLPVFNFAENWIKDLILNGKVAIEEANHG